MSSTSTINGGAVLLHCSCCDRPQEAFLLYANGIKLDNLTVICKDCTALLGYLNFETGNSDDTNPKGYSRYHSSAYWTDLRRFVADSTDNYVGTEQDAFTFAPSKYRISSEQQRARLQAREQILDITMDMCYNRISRDEGIAKIQKLYNNGDY